MDINLLREIITIISFITFVGILYWAWKRRQSKDFKDAAELPFLDE